MKKLYIGIALICLLSGTFNIEVCRGEQTYSIGAILPITGELASYGDFIKKGVELALDEVNTNAAKKGIVFKVIYEDNKSNPIGSITAIRQMIDVHKVSNVIGPLSSRNFVPVAKFAQKRKTVIMSLVSSNPEIRLVGEYAFSLYPLDEIQGRGLSELALKRGYKEMALLYIDNQYGTGVRDQFKKSFLSKGGQILVERSIGIQQLTFEGILQEIIEKQPQAIVHISQIRTALLLYNQAKKLGITKQWIAGVEQRSQELIDQGKENVEGVIGVLNKIPESKETRDFNQAFKKKYNTKKLLWSEYGYDAIKLIALAIQGGGYQADNIRNNLFEMSRGYSGASGIKTFDMDGIVEGNFGVWEVRNGKIIEL